MTCIRGMILAMRECFFWNQEGLKGGCLKKSTDFERHDETASGMNSGVSTQKAKGY